jgi:hypothetical protein
MIKSIVQEKSPESPFIVENHINTQQTIKDAVGKDK